MAPYDDTTAATRLDSFDVYETFFKQIGEHKIKVAILVPKDLKPGKVPLAVKFHGGGLVTGDALFTDWIGAFLVPFMHRNNAIMVLPNYRFLPESSGADILEDLADFWSWFNDRGVDKYLASHNIKVDFDYEHLLVSGDSAGGYMALQSGLTRPAGEIKVILAQYPMTNITRRSQADKVFGFDIPSKEWLDEKLDTLLKPGAIVSSAHPFESDRFQLIMALEVHGRLEEFFGTEKRLWPMTALESVRSLPPTTIFQATEDSAVKFQGTVDFIEKARKLIPNVDIRLAYAREAEHGFDCELKEDEEPWLKEELKWLEEKWLS